jgi:hypothetical protein
MSISRLKALHCPGCCLRCRPPDQAIIFTHPIWPAKY